MATAEVLALPAWPLREGLLEIFANSKASSARIVLVKMRTQEVIRELALAARRDGRSVHLSRPELNEALDEHWGNPPTEGLTRGRARTRSLLTWHVSG